MTRLNEQPESNKTNKRKDISSISDLSYKRNRIKSCETYKGSRSNFKMYINKSFGDILSPGNELESVSAHIVEITETGLEIERLDLTRQINIFSNNKFLVIDSFTIINSSMCALIEVQPAADMNLASVGTIYFHYQGDAGSMKRYIRFHISGKA
jgi:hypothetical protein